MMCRCVTVPQGRVYEGKLEVIVCHSDCGQEHKDNYVIRFASLAEKESLQPHTSSEITQEIEDSHDHELLNIPMVSGSIARIPAKSKWPSKGHFPLGQTK